MIVGQKRSLVLLRFALTFGILPAVAVTLAPTHPTLASTIDLTLALTHPYSDLPLLAPLGLPLLLPAQALTFPRPCSSPPLTLARPCSYSCTPSPESVLRGLTWRRRWGSSSRTTRGWMRVRLRLGNIYVLCHVIISVVHPIQIYIR